MSLFRCWRSPILPRVPRVPRGLFCICLAVCANAASAEGKPEIKSKSVSYVIAGHAATLTFYGENLTPNSIKADKPQVKVKLGGAKATEGDDKKKGSRQVQVEIAPAANCPPENIELTLTQADGSKTATQISVVEDTASEIKEKKPNTTFAQAMPLPGDGRSVAVTGNVDGDNASTFRFDAHSGETWRFRVFAGRGGSPLDPVLRLRDSRHMSLGLAAGNAKNDVTLTFAAPATGTYYLEIMDEQSRGGGAFTYRLTVQITKNNNIQVKP